MRIRTKLALGFAGVAVASAALVALSFLRLNEQSLARAQEAELERTTQDIRRLQQEAAYSQDPLLLIDGLKMILNYRTDIAWFRVHRNGQALQVDPKEARSPKDVLIQSVSSGTPGEGAQVEIAFSRPYLRRLREQESRTALANMRRTVVTVLPFALLLGLALSLSLSGRIEALSRTLEEIGQGRFGAKTSVGGNDEVGKLAANVNTMSTKLQELEDMKRVFIASVTHELRSPLASIESCVRLIRSEPTQRTQVESDMLRRIQVNASRLGHFVTNLLEMAKIERGKLDLQPQPTDLKALMEDAVLFFEPRAKEAGLALDLRVNGEIPPSIRLDPDLITQVIGNLVSNAIKFTPKGGRIEVAAHRKTEGTAAWVECSVKDTGVGIPREAQGKIFAPFQRLQNSTKASGTGLGLAISKSIVDLHGGRIGLESEAGRGSRFFFHLPLTN